VKVNYANYPFSDAFPLVFVWFSYDFHSFPMVFLWFSYGFPMIPVGRDFSPVKPTSAPCLVVTLAKGRPAPAASSERAAACGSEGFSGKR
jgi:hypothetical protein